MIEKLAAAFVIQVRKDVLANGNLFPQRTMEEIDKANAGLPSDYCASHNHCDANVSMGIAFKAVTGRTLDLDSLTDLDLVDQAWKFAKVQGFSQVSK